MLRGIRRSIGSAKQGKAPATADLIGQMLALCPRQHDRSTRRDRALLAFGFAGAFRRSELCALQVGDLSETPDGLRVLIRRSKGDQEGQGQEVDSPRLSPTPGRGGCRRGSPRRRSAPVRCSGPWLWAARCLPWRWQTTARKARIVKQYAKRGRPRWRRV